MLLKFIQHKKHEGVGIMNISLINRSIVSLLLVLRSFSVVGFGISFYTFTMENDDTYKKICTIQVPRAITLATNVDNIAVGTALGPVKLYDTKGIFKKDIPHCGDGGIVIGGVDNNYLYQVNRKGKFFNCNLKFPVVERNSEINKVTHSIATTGSHVFFGSDDAAVHVWDSLKEKVTHSYTGKRTGQVTNLEVTNQAIVVGCSDGYLASIDQEKDTEIWSFNHDSYPMNRVLLRALTKNGSLCYAGYRDGEIILADPDKMIHDHVGLVKYIYALAFLKSGYLAVGQEGGIGLYDIRKFRTPLVEFCLDDKYNRVIALQATEKGFVSIAQNGTVDIWEEAQ